MKKRIAAILLLGCMVMGSVGDTGTGIRSRSGRNCNGGRNRADI